MSNLKVINTWINESKNPSTGDLTGKIAWFLKSPNVSAGRDEVLIAGVEPHMLGVKV